MKEYCRPYTEERTKLLGEFHALWKPYHAAKEDLDKFYWETISAEDRDDIETWFERVAEYRKLPGTHDMVVHDDGTVELVEIPGRQPQK